MPERNEQIPGNERTFDDLSKLQTSGEAIAFVGAGASAGLYPLWHEVIQQLIGETVDRGLAAEADQLFWLELKKTRPQQVIRSLKLKLGDGIYGQIIREIFSPKAGLDGKFYTPIHSVLLRMRFRAYVTTNYDPGLLEARTALRSDSRAMDFATWADNDTISRWITDEIFKEQPCPILFAHGIYDRSETIVLGTSEYRGAYHAGPYRRLFDKLWAQKRLVFVGFGFSDPWLDFLADEVLTHSAARTSAQPRHIALIGLRDDQSYSHDMRELFRDQYNASVLFYKIKSKPDGGEDHSDLLHVLERVSQTKGETEITDSSRVVSGRDDRDGHSQSRTQDREYRLRAMLADHSGFVRDRLVSFVGRANELAEIRQRIAEKLPHGGYITITGQAGQGKSSVIAKLVEEWGLENVAYHFIPFNPGPDHQISLLRNLMARLIIKYKLSDLYVASESRPALRDFLPNVLTQVTERGGREVIFIDGLDQLQEDFNGERDLSFLPTNLPAGIVCVLGTRPNDALTPLELLKPHLEYRLPDLTRSDFDLILIARGVTLGRELADRFYSAMQANALYLDLLAKELAEAGEIDPGSLIQGLAINPDNIFSLSTDRLRRQQWQWREVIKPTLGLLLAARMPLGQLAIRQLLGVDGQNLREALQKLGGLLTQDVKGHYHLFHLKLRDFLRQDEQRPHQSNIFDVDEEEVWHSRLADWCEAGDLAMIWQDDKHNAVEQERRIYAREHYITHLYLAKRWEKLWAVLDAGLYGKAKLQYDPSTRSYANDLRLGCNSLTRDILDTAQKRALLPRLWRYVLLHSSLSGKAKLYPEELFTLLVLKHRDREAIELVEFLPRAETKVIALCRIAQALGYIGQNGEALMTLQRARGIAREVTDKWDHATVFRMLARTLAELQEWDEAINVAYTLGDSIGRVDTLAMIAEELAAAGEKKRFEQLVEKIKHLAGLIGYSHEHEVTFQTIVRILDKPEDWKQTIKKIWLTDKSKPADKVIVMLSKALVGAGNHGAARSMVYTVDGRHHKSEILGSVVKQLTKLDDRTSISLLLSEMIEFARSAEGAEKINNLISAALFYWAIGHGEMAVRLLAGSLSSIQVVDDSIERIQTLVAFAEEIAELGGLDSARSILEEAQRLVPRIRVELNRSAGVKVIADTYARLGDDVTAAELYTQAGWAPLALLSSEDIDYTVNILTAQGYVQQAIALLMTDKYLEELVQDRNWDEAIESARRVTSPQQRAAKITVIVRSVLRMGERELALQFLQEAIDIAADISEEKSRMQVYIAIVAAAAEAEDLHNVTKLSNVVIGSINLFSETKEKVEVLCEIATSLAVVGLKDFGLGIVTDLMRIVSDVDDYAVRSYVLRKLCKVMTQYEDFDRLIALIQQHWLRVTIRDEAVKLLSIVAGLISRDSKTIYSFTQSFSWVDDFLNVT